MRTTYTRSASHAGSWYSSNVNELRRELDGYLDAAAAVVSRDGTITNDGDVDLRGIIAPHAGYRFSGPTAAYAYSPLAAMLCRPDVTRVVVLGPSHHFRLEGGATTRATLLQTPFGCLAVDIAATSQLRGMPGFIELSPEQDEEEHSIEVCVDIDCAFRTPQHGSVWTS